MSTFLTPVCHEALSVPCVLCSTLVHSTAAAKGDGARFQHVPHLPRPYMALCAACCTAGPAP